MYTFSTNNNYYYTIQTQADKTIIKLYVDLFL